MAVSKERIELILCRFSMLFTPPQAVEHCQPGAVVQLWHGLFFDCDEAAFNAAARTLVLTIKRFPCPADFVEVMAQALTNTAQAATENVASGG